MATFSSTILYDVFNQKDDMVTMKVNYGFHQMSATLVKLDMDNLGDFNDGFELEVGANSFLRGKQLVLFATIGDVNPDFDQVTMEVSLEGGKKEFRQMVLDSSVPTNGTISGIVSILFF